MTAAFGPHGVITAQSLLASSSPARRLIRGTRNVRGAETANRSNAHTIDQVVEDLDLSRVDFIKLDIEGAESQAILGAKQTLARFQPPVAIATEHTDDVLANSKSVLNSFLFVRPKLPGEVHDAMQNSLDSRR
jgi:acetylornithine/succinyldiaminopimelate/putrescine aminotransferase